MNGTDSFSARETLAVEGASYEARLDEAYGQWKRPVFTSLFEPWILDRRAAEAARKLRHG